MKGILLVLALLLSFNNVFSEAIYNKKISHDINVNDLPFREACSAGLVRGCKIIRKYGVNPNLASGVSRDIWDFGAADAGNVDYTYPEDGTAPIDTLSSSHASDSQLLLISGRDALGYNSDQFATVNGQNKVTLTFPLWRIHRVVNLEASTTATMGFGFNGNLYVYEDTPIVLGVPTDVSKVRAYIFDGNNQTQMSQFTIEKGWVGFNQGGSTKMTKKQAAVVIYQVWARSYGSVFRLSDNGALHSQGTGSFTSPSFASFMIPELTDIVIMAESDTSAVGVATEYSIMLLEKAVWGIQ